MVDVYAIDFETYYDKDYSLSRLPMYKYVMDERFEAIMLACKNVRTGEERLFVGDEVNADNLSFLRDSFVVAHNMAFDAVVLAWRFNVIPKMYFDTYNMARVMIPWYKVQSYSLANLAKYFGIGAKGKKVADAIGFHLSDMSKAFLAEYKEYCINDTRLCAKMFSIMFNKCGFKNELRYIDLLIRMFADRRIMLDDNMLKKVIDESNAKKLKVVLDSGVPKDVLTSTKKFCEELGRRIHRPVYTADKRSMLIQQVLNGAFGDSAKKLVEARLVMASNIEATRAERLREIHALHSGRLPVPLRYFAAHTGRVGGMDKINLQNPPRGSMLRKALMAPAGYVFVVGDSSNIEARMLATMAGCDKLVRGFRNNEDVYSEFAARVFHVEQSQIKNPSPERFVGKTCILGLGYGASAAALNRVFVANNIKFESVQDLVNMYREYYREIPAFWVLLKRLIRKFQNACRYSTVTKSFHIPVGGEVRTPTPLGDRYGLFKYTFTNENGRAVLTIHVPSSPPIYYTANNSSDNAFVTFVNVPAYDRGSRRVNFWHGLLCENLTQKLARDVVFEQMLEVNARYPVVLTVHDEIVCLAPEEEADEAKAFVENAMRKPPSWLPELPVDCEVSVAKRYGDAK